MNKILVGAGSAILFAGAYWFATSDETTAVTPTSDVVGTAIVSINLPDRLGANAEIGKTIYDAKCAACHAPGAVGQVDIAPPLVHIIYEPSHHADEAFQRAAAYGVRAHHWKFGNMPPVEGVTRGDMAMVIAYVRELQRANGIN